MREKRNEGMGRGSRDEERKQNEREKQREGGRENATLVEVSF